MAVIRILQEKHAQYTDTSVAQTIKTIKRKMSPAKVFLNRSETARICAQAGHLSPRSSAAERSCWDSWSWGKSSGPPLRASCWSRDPSARSSVRVWRRRTRWSGGGLAGTDRPSWGAARAGTRRHSYLWQTASSSFNSNGSTGFSTADSWTALNSFSFGRSRQMASAPLRLFP